MDAKEYCDAKNSYITREVTVRRFDRSKLQIGTAYKVFQVYNDPVVVWGRQFLFNGILQSIKDHDREIVLVTARTTDKTTKQLYRIFEYRIEETSTMMAITIDIENIADGQIIIQPYYANDVAVSIDVDNDEEEE